MQSCKTRKHKMSEIPIHCQFSEMILTEKCIEHPKNANIHSKEQIERLASLIEHYGWRHPIIISAFSGYVVAGHARLAAAKLLKLEKIPVNFQDFSSVEEEYGFLIADNSIAFWAGLDLSTINHTLPELGPDFNIDLLGIKDFTLDISEKVLEDEPKKTKSVTCPECKFEFTL